jgi:diadenosine tetraphosphate (Ap4A) HIT family hydrolase
MPDCIFCKDLPKVTANDLAYVLFDINPVSKGHAIIIPKRHVEHIFDVTPQEMIAMHELLKEMRAKIAAEHSPDGYNIFSNCGRTAGQVVMHAHMHLVPRYKGQPIHINDHVTQGDA